MLSSKTDQRFSRKAVLAVRTSKLSNDLSKRERTCFMLWTLETALSLKPWSRADYMEV